MTTATPAFHIRLTPTGHPDLAICPVCGMLEPVDEVTAYCRPCFRTAFFLRLFLDGRPPLPVAKENA
jgi:hypothetical protein